MQGIAGNLCYRIVGAIYKKRLEVHPVDSDRVIQRCGPKRFCATVKSWTNTHNVGDEPLISSPLANADPFRIPSGARGIDDLAGI